MKSLSFFLLLAGILLTGCGSKELSKDEAIQLLKKEKGYPRAIDRSIFCRDQGHAKMVFAAGLEKSGMVTINEGLSLRDVIAKEPIIKFTDKAKPYLLPTTEEDSKDKIQRVKLAEEEIVEVTSIISDKDSKTVTVNYTTHYSNLTPFAVLATTKLDVTTKENTATFALSDENGWILQKRN
ncbi:hypothetical protein FMM05_19355 [Flavobacterium zepuense]|uniref:Lipoprotein n=1 Tax=Flavobacterium zepuense TaxID=2593302 RepID=A0A552UUM2_9FLAO|nr:hypothetical protein [Flavobacterium zepuense]TRW21948.1 hypothetical protein FMM05_19355 [Flavobacterium zepuense]